MRRIGEAGVSVFSLLREILFYPVNPVSEKVYFGRDESL